MDLPDVISMEPWQIAHCKGSQSSEERLRSAAVFEDNSIKHKYCNNVSPAKIMSAMHSLTGNQIQLDWENVTFE